MRWLFVCLVSMFFVGCMTTSDYVTGENTMNFYSLADDIKFGVDSSAQLDAQMKEQGVKKSSDSKEIAKLKGMVSRIAKVSDLPNLPYEVTLYSSETVNAMAVPGGKIFVFDGLWDSENGLVKDDDELAAVIAHEIAHVTCRHSTESMSRQAVPTALLGAGMVYAGADDNEKLQYILGGAFIAYNGLIIPHYSRKDEFEADRVGMRYMAKAGYNPEAALRIWERAAKLSGSGSSPLNIFSTHPSDSARLAALRAELPMAKVVYNNSKL